MSDVPVGGSTGCDHQDNPTIGEAARYVAGLSIERRPSPIVPHLRERFGLTAKEACEAIREGNLIIARAL